MQRAAQPTLVRVLTQLLSRFRVVDVYCSPTVRFSIIKRECKTSMSVFHAVFELRLYVVKVNRAKSASDLETLFIITTALLRCYSIS